MHFKGLDNDFPWNKSGEDNKTLQDFLNNPSVIEHGCQQVLLKSYRVVNQ
jgi:hypothetical protein